MRLMNLDSRVHVCHKPSGSFCKMMEERPEPQRSALTTLELKDIGQKSATLLPYIQIPHRWNAQRSVTPHTTVRGTMASSIVGSLLKLTVLLADQSNSRHKSNVKYNNKTGNNPIRDNRPSWHVLASNGT
jgi:hypothetical protein